MRVFSLFLLCCPMLIVPKAYCQDQRVIDSLKRVIADQKVRNIFPAFYDLAFEYINSDRSLALHFIKEAERSAIQSGDTLGIVKSKRVQSQILYLSNEPYQAIAVLQPLLKWKLSAIDASEHYAVLDHLGLCNSLIGQFDRSMELNFHALQAARRLNDVGLVTISLTHIGFTYYKLKDYRKALQYFLQAQTTDISEKARITSYINLSLIYSHLDQFDSAEVYLQRHEQLCGDGCNDDQRMHRAYAAGCRYFRMGRLMEAEREFLSSLSLARELKDSRIQLDNIYLLAKINLQERRPITSAEYLKEGENLIRSHVPFNIEMIKVFGEQSSLYWTNKNYQKAAEYQAKYIALKDSIYNESVTNRLMEIESHFLERRNEARIAEQEEIIFLNNEIIRRQKWLNLLSVVIVILTGLVIFYLVRSYRKKHALNVLLDQKVKERTGELENTRQELLKYIHEKEAAFSRSWSGVHASVKTLKGLCHAASTEVSDPVARQYLEKIETTSREVDRKFIAFSE